jgi:hypothetical protein
MFFSYTINIKKLETPIKEKPPQINVRVLIAIS